MKKRTATLGFICGTVFGVFVALCLGAAEKKAAEMPKPAPEPPRSDWSHLQFVAYPGGGTGIFDPATATFYLYDSDLIYCSVIREITALGAPLRRIRN